MDVIENEIDKLNSQIDSLEKEIDKKLIQRVDYKTEINFLKEHGLMLIKEKDLKNLKEMFYDPNLVGLLYNLNNCFPGFSLQTWYDQAMRCVSIIPLTHDQSLPIQNTLQANCSVP